MEPRADVDSVVDPVSDPIPDVRAVLLADLGQRASCGFNRGIHGLPGVVEECARPYLRLMVARHVLVEFDAVWRVVWHAFVQRRSDELFRSVDAA
jgi:hypothetical protein